MDISTQNLEKDGSTIKIAARSTIRWRSESYLRRKVFSNGRTIETSLLEYRKRRISEIAKWNEQLDIDSTSRKIYSAMVASSNSTANGLLKNFEDFQLSINNLYVQMKSPPGDLPN